MGPIKAGTKGEWCLIAGSGARDIWSSTSNVAQSPKGVVTERVIAWPSPGTGFNKMIQ